MNNTESTKSDVAKREEETLALWRERDIFKKTLEKKNTKGEFVFYEGPPTSNGRPGIHHMESRSFKDVIPRYKTMRGYHVRRKAGWDTHGLPVEIEVEKRLGLTSKKQIEEYGIAQFNDQCKESVWTYLDEWQTFTERIGYWVDLGEAYVTYYPQYIESVWNIMKHVSDKGLLYKDYKVVPWCPRCGTGLSSHELAQGYTDVKDLSVYVWFKLVERDEYILAWTTTPWTLPGNVALAVGETIVYAKVELDGKRTWVAQDRLGALGFNEEPLEVCMGNELVGLSYEPLFPYLAQILSPDQKEKLENAFKVYPADFVTTTDGTGIVHTAVMYGQDDFELGNTVGLPKYHTVNETGKFVEGTGLLEGMSVVEEDTTVAIIKDLAHRGLLFKKEKYEHTYPFCWRCKTRLIYYARDSWYIRMSDLRSKLVKENESINWVPSHIRDGRFGEWLKEVKDWAISRNRYWGTPLPVWRCNDCSEQVVVGSIQDLLERTPQSNNTYFVMRHGRALSNDQDTMSTVVGASNDCLTDTGKEQVAEVLKRMRKGDFDLIITSPFGRTTETARMVFERLELPEEAFIVDDRLHEVNAGVLNGKPVPDYDAFFNGSDWMTRTPEGGESPRDVKKRVGEFLYDIEQQYKDKKILIVTHGGPARMLFVSAGASDQHFVGAYASMFRETAELHPLAFVPLPHNEHFELDLHRPFIDDHPVKCTCGQLMTRVEEVMDVWFDSGAMPFAQDHYPFENKEWVDDSGFPADYISEAIDQTRGWFYTLHAIGVLMGKGKAYKNVICLGHVLDAEGKKMSKSVGNVVNPWEMIDKYGADVLRFWMYSVNQPGDSKNFDEKTVDEVHKKVFQILRNTVRFYTMYAGDSSADVDPRTSDHVLDQWVLATCDALVAYITNEMDAYHVFEPTRAIRDFVQDFSTWYIRRSRDRFKSDDTKDRAYAIATTRMVLLTLAKLMAPFAPFTAEEMYQDIGGELESVHLEDWPKGEKVDEDILTLMNEVRRLVSLALEARTNAGIKIRQPLASLAVRTDNKKLKEHAGLLAVMRDELNVKEIRFADDLGWEVEFDTTVTPELKTEGQVRELVRAIQDLRKEANLQPADGIVLVVQTDSTGKTFVESNKDIVMKAVNAEDILFQETEGKTITLDDMTFGISFKI